MVDVMTSELTALTQWDIPDHITPGGDMLLSLSMSVVMSAATTLIFIDLIWIGIFIYDSSY